MKAKRLVTVMLTGCAAVVLLAVPALLAQTPPAHQHAATLTAKPQAAMGALLKSSGAVG